jgi:hypothetical protein
VNKKRRERKRRRENNEGKKFLKNTYTHSGIDIQKRKNSFKIYIIENRLKIYEKHERKQI